MSSSSNQAAFCLLAPQASFCLLRQAGAKIRPTVTLQLTDLTQLNK